MPEMFTEKKQFNELLPYTSKRLSFAVHQQRALLGKTGFRSLGQALESYESLKPFWIVQYVHWKTMTCYCPLLQYICVLATKHPYKNIVIGGFFELKLEFSFRGDKVRPSSTLQTRSDQLKLLSCTWPDPFLVHAGHYSF